MYALLNPLPPNLRALIPLALDLRWTWCHSGDALWQQVDGARWASTRNPWLTLQAVSEQHLAKLSTDPLFCAELVRLDAERQRYLTSPSWYDRRHSGDARLLVAYFSMEFGLGEALPFYAGGLGILAGDHLKTASDLGVPLVGVGLLYSQGYFRQTLDAQGWQHALYPISAPTSLPIQPALGADGRPLRVEVELPGRSLLVQVWHAQVGRVSLYLLDSNDPSNSPADRGITSQLYGGDDDNRLLQEVVLGIAGWRALTALGLEPSVCHLNEGHAAFAAIERARQFASQQGVSFRHARWATRAGNVFTTHTPVAAAFDTYPFELITRYVATYAQQAGIDPAEFLALRERITGADNESFNMAYLAARTCGRINAVSRLHGQVSRAIFQPLFPRWPEHEVPVSHVTNGVHVPSWDSVWADRLWTEACGKGRWLGALESVSQAIDAQSDETLWFLRARQRQDLIAYVRRRLARQVAQRGGSSRDTDEAASVLDPNVLTIGFARRFTAYKRPDLLLHDTPRLLRLLEDPARPVQFIIAGKAHPRDDEGRRMIHAWLEFASRPQVRCRAVFLEDYDIALAQELVQGVDVWLNTPKRPWEACGTSGMKVLVNGGLNLSVRDGWWAEACDPEVGWAVGNGADDDTSSADALDLYRRLENDVVPAFYERDSRGIPAGWVRRMRASLSKLTPQFSSNRMLAEYVQNAYVPAARDFAGRSRESGRAACEAARFEDTLARHWHELHLTHCRSSRAEGVLSVQVHAYLGGIGADQVRVQLYADPTADEPAVCVDMVRDGAIAGVTNGHEFQITLTTNRPAADFTPRIIARHDGLSIPVELSLIYWLPR